MNSNLCPVCIKSSLSKNSFTSTKHQNFFQSLKDARRTGRSLAKENTSADVNAALAYLEKACQVLGI